MKLLSCLATFFFPLVLLAQLNIDAGLSFNLSRTESGFNNEPTSALAAFFKPNFSLPNSSVLFLKTELAAKIHGMWANDCLGCSRQGSNLILNNYLGYLRVFKKPNITWDYGASGLLIYDYRYGGAPFNESRTHRIFPGAGVNGGLQFNRFKLDLGYHVPFRRYRPYAAIGIGYRF